MIARRLIVHGRVQGVFYRGWTVETATALGLTGWVRNRMSGDVEILAIGSAASIDALVKQCWEGPPVAKVTAIDVEEAEVEPLHDFRQRPTA